MQKKMMGKSQLFMIASIDQWWSAHFDPVGNDK
jgi:hypothetical protein